VSPREILRLFEQVLELPEGERDAFLRSVPGQREELEALLEKEREGDDFPRLDVPTRAFAELGLSTTDLAAGTRIGSFRIERLLGSGGMGRVHLAEQENPHRQVALKTLRRGLDSEEAFQRFRMEGELLGRLRHPGIAQVYETGVQRITTDGNEVELPYIAMELLESARSIVEHADAQGLGLDARLRLMIDVARAVQHAHQKGVIHRDLKPGNIVVDADGRARIIDFGIARAAELEQGNGEVQTRAGHVVGTPAYMSPEQLTLPSEELDTRVDVYALGAVLYELVCGRAPFETGHVPIAGLAREITEQGPPRPRSLAPDLPRDLEAILLAALARERDERYASAAAFADDLERFLRHETIEARRPTMLHQLRLFARRNRLFAASLLVAVLSLAAAAFISLSFARKERLARMDADAYLQEALETNFSLVFDYAVGIASLQDGVEFRVYLLRSAMDKLGSLEDEARRDPKNLSSLALAYAKLGDALGALDQPSLGDHAGAARAYAKAAALLDGIASDDVTFRRTWMAIEEAQAERARAERNLDETLAHFEKALELCEAECAAHPGDDNLRKYCAQRRRDVGNAHGSLGEWERSLEHFEEAYFELGELLRENPADAPLRFAHANTLASVGSATLNSISPEDSLPIYRDALHDMEDLLIDFPNYRTASASLVGIRYPFTEALVRAEHLDEAIEECETGLFLSAEFLAEDPRDLQMGCRYARRAGSPPSRRRFSR